MVHAHQQQHADRCSRGAAGGEGCAARLRPPKKPKEVHPTAARRLSGRQGVPRSRLPQRPRAAGRVGGASPRARADQGGRATPWRRPSPRCVPPPTGCCERRRPPRCLGQPCAWLVEPSCSRSARRWPPSTRPGWRRATCRPTTCDAAGTEKDTDDDATPSCRPCAIRPPTWCSARWPIAAPSPTWSRPRRPSSRRLGCSRLPRLWPTLATRASRFIGCAVMSGASAASSPPPSAAGRAPTASREPSAATTADRCIGASPRKPTASAGRSKPSSACSSATSARRCARAITTAKCARSASGC